MFFPFLLDALWIFLIPQSLSVLADAHFTSFSQTISVDNSISYIKKVLVYFYKTEGLSMTLTIRQYHQIQVKTTKQNYFTGQRW